jgi:hypothetical protein
MTLKKKSGEYMLNTCKKDTSQKYVSGAKLTYNTKIKQLLKEELGYQGKPKVLDLLASEIEKITKECYVSPETMGIGQVRVLVPNINDRPTWGQRIEDTNLVPVVLTLIAAEDNEAYKDNDKPTIINQRKLARIASEAINQGGVLTTAVAGQLLGVKQATISRYVALYYERESKIIPLRGFVHDMGKTTTHKRWIISLYLKGYTTNEIQKMTDHKVLSIDRYVKRYNAVSECIEELKTMDEVKISRLMSITQNSAKEYVAIYKEYKETGNISRLDYYSKINKKTDEILREPIQQNNSSME